MEKIIIILFLHFSMQCTAQKNGFMWGVASASYQVEGAYKADGKGLSNWDVYTNEYEVTKAFTAKNQTGNVSVNQYDRKQYLKDFALMKKLGVTHYRFSLSWARLLPEGTGKINIKGIRHYQKFINDMLSFGIEPCVTLYHWDLPQALQLKGGWGNPESIDWFVEYSNLVFKSFGRKVKTYITFNEPNIDLFLITTSINNIKAKKENPFAVTSQEFANQAPASYHLCVASAKAINNYHEFALGGQIGITLNLIPTIPKDTRNEKDVSAANLQDGIHNRWFLDASLKGSFPEDVLNYYKKYNINIPALQNTVTALKQWEPDFIGVNFYSPAYVSYDEKFANNINWMTNNPDTIPMFNGVVKPDYLYKLLMRLKNDYNNPSIIITENGAGFGDRDEKIINGKINDSLRTSYVKRHIDAALKAKQDGARLNGYFLWSILDNFEWIWGYDKRFGIVHVNFETQERLPKNSFYVYKEIIESYKQKN